ncbi:MAG TPA: hypothetical protein VFR24_22860 [Candidatus Angelobacter sp.]|nr:hypothetical protein [Candidatus Angelobacter sp.]
MRGTILWLLLLSGALPGTAQQSSSIEQLLRLQPGNFWVYKGTVKWANTPAGGIIDIIEPNGQIEYPRDHGSYEVTYKIQVLEKYVHGPVTAYVVRGSFLDLEIYYGFDHEPELCVWATYAGGFYNLGAVVPDFLKLVRNPADSLVEYIKHETPWITFPLREGECPKSMDWKAGHPQPQDTVNCGRVSREQPSAVHLQGVNLTNAEIWEFASEDHVYVDVTRIALGVGIIQADNTDRELNHDMHVKLVEAHLQ